MRNLSIKLVLWSLSSAMMLVSSSPVAAGGDTPTLCQAAQTQAVEPVQVPLTAQEWFDRMRLLTREMSPTDVIDVIGRAPDVMGPKKNGRITWTYRFVDPNDKSRTRTIWVYFRDGRYVQW